MSDEPTRRIPPADDPTQIQPPPRQGTAPDAPSSYAATQRMDAFQGEQAGQGVPTGQGSGGYDDQTQILPPSGAGTQQRDYRAAVPPPARPVRPYETEQPTQAMPPAQPPTQQMRPQPGAPAGYGQGAQGYPPQPGYSPAGQQGYGQQDYGQQGGYPQQGQPGGPNPFEQGRAPQTPSPQRDYQGRDGDQGGGGAMAGAVLAWIPRILLVLGVYQLVRLVPGFDVMPDVSQFPLFRGIGDGILGMLNLNPEWSDQAANLTIPVLGILLAGLFNAIRSLGTSIKIWPYGLTIIAWIVVFAVGGIVGYAQDATADMKQNVRESVDNGVEDAKEDAKDSVQKEIDEGVQGAKDDAQENIEQGLTDQLEENLPGGNG